MEKKKAARKANVKPPLKSEANIDDGKNKLKKQVEPNQLVKKGHDDIEKTKPSLLTEREIEILQSMANGNSSKQIADKLKISFDTVESHRKSIHKKIGVNTATEAIAYGFRNEIIT